MAPGHRHHHIASKAKGGANFGLFPMLWDHLLGTFVIGRAAPREGELGVVGRPYFPVPYWSQLVGPSRRWPDHEPPLPSEAMAQIGVGPRRRQSKSDLPLLPRTPPVWDSRRR